MSDLDASTEDSLDSEGDKEPPKHGLLRFHRSRNIPGVRTPSSSSPSLSTSLSSLTGFVKPADRGYVHSVTDSCRLFTPRCLQSLPLLGGCKGGINNHCKSPPLLPSSPPKCRETNGFLLLGPLGKPHLTKHSKTGWILWKLYKVVSEIFLYKISVLIVLICTAHYLGYTLSS